MVSGRRRFPPRPRPWRQCFSQATGFLWNLGMQPWWRPRVTGDGGRCLTGGKVAGPRLGGEGGRHAWFVPYARPLAARRGPQGPSCCAGSLAHEACLCGRCSCDLRCKECKVFAPLQRCWRGCIGTLWVSPTCWPLPTPAAGAGACASAAECKLAADLLLT